MDVRFHFIPFHQLSVDQLYQVLKLRVDVFVVEQNCAYAELDNQDQKAMHILGVNSKDLLAYARILFEKGHLHIGRIIVSESHRNQGLGRKILESAIEYCQEHYPNESIHLSAQAHLEQYYQSFGFTTISEEAYDWDGILHVDMVLV